MISLPGPVSRYSEILAAAFTELGDYWRGQVIPASQVKEEQPLRELSLPLPPEASPRLCFFALPLSVLSFYKDKVFPVAREHGFVLRLRRDVVYDRRAGSNSSLGLLSGSSS